MATAIRIEHLSKLYRVGVIGYGMLYKDLQSWIARRLGRDDPHAPIAESTNAAFESRFWALKDINLQVEQGSRVGILGNNGAGKSTLLKILSRITNPTEGRVFLRGRVASLLEVGTGFQPELTGRENIYLNGTILGMKRREINQKMDEIIAFSEIESFIDTPIKRYSSGMFVRLAFSVAAHLESEILLADEVLAVGDIGFQNKCLGKMEDVNKKEGRTIIFVSHNVVAVRSLCQYGIYLKHGRLEDEAPIDDIIDRYIGTPSIQKEATVDVSRTGNQRALFSSIKMVNEDGAESEKFVQGRGLAAVLEITANAEGDHVLDCGLSIHPSTGEILFVDYTSYHGVRVEMKNSKTTLRFSLASLDLSPGSYYLRVRLLDNGEEADWIQVPVAHFNVVSGDFYGTGSTGFDGRSFFAVRSEWKQVC